MTLPLIKLLRAGPPPPKVVLLPDAMFFTRAVPIAAGSSPASTASQVELALETLSPFPPAQLYHGFYWEPGAERALVFAAYRRRFTTDQAAAWETAELVLPAFASLLGGDVKTDTTVIVPSDEGLTALVWDNGSVPAKVVFRPLPAEASDEERARARDELLGATPRNRSIVLTAAPAIEATRREREFAFRAEAFASRLPAERAGAMDVRDKDALAALRSARRRDLVLWRGFLAFVGVLIVLGLGELALVGVGLWQKTRIAQADAQRPVVDKIMAAQSLTTRINELSSKRLLPLEMITFVFEKKPVDVRLVRTTTVGLYGLSIEGSTQSPTAVSTFQTALSADPAMEKVEVRDNRSRDNVTTFTFVVTFRPDAIVPATQ